jgi:hypothetical protein
MPYNSDLLRLSLSVNAKPNQVISEAEARFLEPEIRRVLCFHHFFTFFASSDFLDRV